MEESIRLVEPMSRPQWESRMTADRITNIGILPKRVLIPRPHCGQKLNFTLISLEVEVFSAAKCPLHRAGPLRNQGFSLEGCAPDPLQVRPGEPSRALERKGPVGGPKIRIEAQQGPLEGRRSSTATKHLNIWVVHYAP